MTNRTRQSSAKGNALMEYAVPAALILLSAGVLVTITGATDIMAEYFMSASGRTKASLSGTTFKTKGLAEDAYGSPGNGLGGFSNFGGLTDGAGGAAAGAGGGMFYAGNANRNGGRQESGSSEYLYP